MNSPTIFAISVGTVGSSSCITRTVAATYTHETKYYYNLSKSLKVYTD
jgi:hypothetical protein